MRLASNQVQIVSSPIDDRINGYDPALFVNLVKYKMLLSNQYAIPSCSQSSIARQGAAFREVCQTVDFLLQMI